MRLFLPVFLIFLSVLVSADSKIKTRNTTMGHGSESTVYIKGARERTEGATMGPGASLVTIMQCDEKRIITVNPQTNACMVTSLAEETSGKSEAAAPAVADAGGKGGTITFNISATDTGERQTIFGLNARHIKSTMNAESSPDACSKTSLHTETDGWYADISPQLTCSYGTSPPASQMSVKAGCHDRVRFKRSGSGHLGYPLKQTVTMQVEGHDFSITSEVVDLSAATLDASLFEMPAGCKQVSTYMELMGTGQGFGSMTAGAGGAKSDAVPPPSVSEPAKAGAAAASAPVPAAPVVAPKGSGVVRVGVVKIGDPSLQLPTENLRLNLMGEITARQLEAVPLDATDPKAIAAEAVAKQCDYILYTDATQVKDPGSGGIAPPAGLRGVSLDNNKYQALLEVTLYRTNRPIPEVKSAPVAADAEQFSVNAVMAAFEKEADRVADQVKRDQEPPRPAKSAPARKPATPKKPG